MKLFLTYLPVLLAATSQARTLRTTTSTCVEGHREQILPGYWVEYKCNVALTGFKYEDVATAKDCAELGKFDKRVCTWKESTKVCIVGDKNGDEAGNPGATCMIPISSPGSGCGGSDKSCNDKLEKCEKKVEALEKKEETCKTKDEACEKKVGELEKKVEALEKKEETCKKKDEDCEKKTEALEKKVEKYGPVSVKCKFLTPQPKYVN
ncbi:hypothetical protein N7532_006329 [Penicillium argentinense]|uniref:Uncharacterized protein n=1 Tax=Penicillium argentinense TaxID=1131581 RepID=A0A9W9KAU6_9EURO|nr:uncharacterized protein N7532_006329 [Penicillium argentinense]KAJ5099328.1 hypothetical protein N7532_006329 [Penicillium argentinense]